MKNLLLFFTLILSVSCQEQKTETFDVNLLNGYWEIEQVTLADGTLKKYKINETIDFFEIKNDSGFRKKVTPQLNGSYLVNDLEEKIKVVKTSDGTYIIYQTEFAKWKEKIKTLTKDQLILENEQQIQYQYKHPISFTKK